MNVVICAGGLNLRYKELSCFPKILLPSKDGTPILIKQLEYFKDASSVSIVINKKFADIMKAYVRVNNLDVKVIVSDNTDGSGNTLSSVYGDLPKKNVLFFWSDILFENDKFDLSVSNTKSNAVIFTVPSAKYRYKVENDVITNRSVNYDGNVPGIFWLRDISEIIPQTPTSEVKDLIDLIQDKVVEGMISISGQKLDTDIVEYKSLEEYKRIISSTTREDISFPSDLDIIYDEDEKMKVVARTDEEKDALTYQDHWLSTLAYTMRASKYSSWFKIEKSDKTGEWTCNMDDLEGYHYASGEDLGRLVNDLSAYTVEVPLSTSVKFLDAEYMDKAIEGYEKVKDLLDKEYAHPDDVVVNAINSARDILIDDMYENTYWVLTHGNINSHNVLVNSKGDMKVINPKTRCNNSMYCHSIVDKSEAYMVKVGLDEALRKEMVYKSDGLPCFKEDVPITVEIAIYLHLLRMLPIFSKDIMKLSIITSYALDGLIDLIDRKIQWVKASS